MTLSRRQFISRSFGTCFLSGLAMFGLSGCSEPNLVRIGSHPWLGYEFLHLGHRLGQLPKHIHFTEYRSASEILSALSKKEIDVATLSLDEVLIARARGIPMTVIMIFDISAGADMVLAPHHTKKLTELAGMRIGYEATAHGQLILHKLLEAAHLTLDDISAVAVAPYQQYDAWKSDQIDIAISYKPYAHPFLAEGFKVIFDSRQLPNMNYDVLAVTPDKLSTLSNSLTDLTTTHFKMLKSFQSNPSDMLYEMTNTIHNRFPIDVMKSGLRGIALPTLERNHAILSDRETLKTIVKGLMPYTGVSADQLPRDLDQLFTNQFLPKNSPNAAYY